MLLTCPLISSLILSIGNWFFPTRYVKSTNISPPGISQWIDGDCVATIGRVKQTARAVEILGSWKVSRYFAAQSKYLFFDSHQFEIMKGREYSLFYGLPELKVHYHWNCCRLLERRVSGPDQIVRGRRTGGRGSWNTGWTRNGQSVLFAILTTDHG